MLQHWIWFARLKGISLHEKQVLLRHFRDPEEIYYSDTDAFSNLEGVSRELLDALDAKDLTQAEAIKAECAAKGIGILTFQDALYPGRLRNIHDAPMVLYYKGTLPDWENVPVIGIVGTRRSTPYGTNTTGRFARQIATCGALVVSGGAGGIDTAAMWGAIDAGKPVVGVLGCGVDVVYPASNRALFSKVVKCGCLISEYPPGTKGFSWHFPARNRIISGMSNGILVVEAPEQSGALNTARHALQQGRDVFVVPANIDLKSCAGSNALLEDGAMPALSGWSVVKEYAAIYPGKVQRAEMDFSTQQVAQQVQLPGANGIALENSDKKSIDKINKSTYSVVNKAASALTQEEQHVLAHISREAVSMDELIDRTELAAGTVKSILTKLSIKGLIVNIPGGCVALKE